MSRSKPSGSTSSPIKKYLDFKGGNGKISFYDKDADEKVLLDNLTFTVLDIKSSISGFNESSSSGISSNMLDPFDVGKKEFIVKSKVSGSFGVVAQGIYKDIKDEVIAMGGKFTTNIIALADVGSGLEVVKLELNGSGLTPWIEFAEENKGDAIYGLDITIGKGQLMKRSKGKNVAVTDKEYKALLAKLKADPMADKPVMFYTPKFTSVASSDEMIQKAVDADVELQKYFDQGESNTGTAEPVIEGAPAPESNDNDDLPF